MALIIWMGLSYGRNWMAVAQAKVCVPDAPQEGAMGGLAGMLCEPHSATTGTTTWGGDEKRVVLTATKALPSPTPDPARVKPTVLVKQVKRKVTPLPSATRLPVTSLPGPAIRQPTPTKPRNDGSGKIGNSSMPCAMEKVAGGGMAIQCKKTVP